MHLAKKKRKLPFVPVTSFGDIAFLLIIFFMLASVFMKEQHIEVDQATAPELEKEKFTVSIVLDKHGELWLQGEPCPHDYLEPAVSQLIDGMEDKLVALKIDRDQKHDNFGSILMALGSAGADVVLIGEKEAKQK